MAFLLSQWHFITKFRPEISYLTSSLNAQDGHTSIRILLKLINQTYSFCRWNTSIYPNVTSLISTREIAKSGQAPLHLSHFIYFIAFFLWSHKTEMFTKQNIWWVGICYTRRILTVFLSSFLTISYFLIF